MRDEHYFYPGKSRHNRDEQHHWLSLAELKDGRRIQSGIARGFDTTLCEDRKAGYAFRFQGLLRVPASGLYVLHMQGSDGYRITVDGREALLWDGPHGPAEKTAVLNLTQGGHPLAVDYFVDKSPVPFFKLEWEGPGLSREEIPAAALCHAESGTRPQMTLAATGGTDGTARITLHVDPRGQKIVKMRPLPGQVADCRSRWSRTRV